MLDRVLLTNDDGVDAPGLAVLEQAASELAREVWVVAPETDQSGRSHSLHLHRTLRVAPRGPRRWAVSGTPGDCAVLGIRQLMRDAPPDLVLSGVNRGMNLGIETVFSGTVGGAMTAMMFGIPAIALSQQMTRGEAVRWDTARGVVPDLVRRLLALGLGGETCLNVNIPDLPPDRVGPLTLTRQGPGLVETIDVEPGGDGEFSLRFRRSDRAQPLDSDAAALRAGRVSVTPIRYDRTDEAAYRALCALIGQ